MNARLPQLDGIRGVAILLVVWWHYYNCGGNSGALATATNWTWAGVDLFFVLSGFLITGILIDEAGATNLLSVFYRRRAARILPAYLLILVAACIRASIGTASIVLPDWYHLTFTQNFIIGREGFGASLVPVTWSLAIEEQFYLVWPMIVILVKAPRIPGVCGCAIVVAIAFRAGTPGLSDFVGTFCRMDSLLFGALGAALVRNKAGSVFLPRLRKWLVLIAGVTIVLGYRFQNQPQSGIFTHTMFGIAGLGIVLASLDAGSLLARVLSFRGLRWMGKISYPLYLVHEFVRGIGSWWIELAVSIALAAVSHHTIEAFFLNLGKRAKYEHSARDVEPIGPPKPAGAPPA